MLQFLARRLLLIIPILLLVSLMVFSLIHLIPGDPATVILGPEASKEVVEALRQKMGLDRPIYIQYLSWVWKILRGDLGRSLVDNKPVVELIGQRLPATLELAAGAFFFSLLIAIPAGILAAVKKGTLLDYGSTVLAVSGLSIPHFWLGMMFILFFALLLGWLPASGYVEPWVDLKQNLRSMILPIAATGLREAAVVTRMLRSSLLEVLKADYIRTARAKGLAGQMVIFGHALKNALIPVVTVSGLQVASLLGGLVITETIFQIPGLGRLLVDSIFNRDFTTVQGAVLLSAVMVIGVNLLVDISYSFLDPRIKLARGTGR